MVEIITPNVTTLAKDTISANSQTMLCKNYFSKIQKIGQLTYINYYCMEFTKHFIKDQKRKTRQSEFVKIKIKYYPKLGFAPIITSREKNALTIN